MSKLWDSCLWNLVSGSEFIFCIIGCDMWQIGVAGWLPMDWSIACCVGVMSWFLNGLVCSAMLSQPAKVMLLLEQERHQWAICLRKSASIVAASYVLLMNLTAEEERFSIFNSDLIIQLILPTETSALLCSALWLEGFRHQISENQIYKLPVFSAWSHLNL